jgi:hypothetical protein
MRSIVAASGWATPDAVWVGAVVGASTGDDDSFGRGMHERILG